MNIPFGEYVWSFFQPSNKQIQVVFSGLFLRRVWSILELWILGKFHRDHSPPVGHPLPWWFCSGIPPRSPYFEFRNNSFAQMFVICLTCVSPWKTPRLGSAIFMCFLGRRWFLETREEGMLRAYGHCGREETLPTCRRKWAGQ